MKFEKEAMEFISAIRELAKNEENLNNFGGYLAYHFDKWLEKYANTPENITSEFKHFAEMEFK